MDNNETHVMYGVSSVQPLDTDTLESNNQKSLLNPISTEIPSIEEQNSLKRKRDTIDSEENEEVSIKKENDKSEENELSTDHEIAERENTMHDQSGQEPIVSKVESRSLSGAQKRRLLKERLKERGQKFDPNWRIKKKMLKALNEVGAPLPSLGSSVKDHAAGNPTKSTVEETEQGNKTTTDDEPMERVNDIITSIRMAVFHLTFPKRKISEKEGRKIQFALIDQFVPLDDGTFPQFTGCYIEKGVLVIACVNEQTVNWLQEMVPCIQIPDSPGLLVRERSYILWGTKIMFKAPAHLVNQYHDQVLDILGNQNKSFTVSEWKVIGRRTDSSGKMFICLVDSTALEAIVTEGYKAFLGLEQIPIKVLLK